MWDAVLNYFGDLEKRPLERMAFLVGGLLVFWIIEGAVPLLQPAYKRGKLRHAAVNLGFTAMHLVIHTFLAIVIVLISDWCKANEFGLVYWTGAGILGTLTISFLLLDFCGGWLVHFTQHKMPLLWRFHVVHHADNNVDVTTGLRHHPVESVLRGVFFFLAIFLSGAPMYAVMMFQTVLILFVAFTHANISLPLWLDRALSFVFVSPNMHKVHHHWQQPFTDTNYGAVLSIWDRLFGTFSTLEPGQIRYGLDRYYPNERDEDFGMLLRRPFGRLE